MLVMIALVALSAAASAQDGPKTVKTERITQSTGEMKLLEVDPEGVVSIDWPAVEALAAAKSDRIALPTAQMMLAIRDGKWKPMTPK